MFWQMKFYKVGVCFFCFVFCFGFWAFFFSFHGIEQGQMQSPAPESNDVLQQHRLKNDWLGSSSAQKDLGILVNSKLKIIQKHVLAARKVNTILSCINRRNTGFRSSKMIILLYPSVQFWATNTGRPEINWSSAQHHRTVRRLEDHLKKTDRRNGVCSLWRIYGFGETYKAAHNIYKDAIMKMQQGSSQQYMGGRTRDKRPKLKL